MRQRSILGALAGALVSAGAIFGPAALTAAAQDTTRVRDTTRTPNVPGAPGLPNVSRGVLVDFQDADLRVVVTALAEAAGLNVVYGDLPARKLTLRLRQPVAPADVLPLLRSVGQSYGLRVVEQGGIVHVDVVDAPGAGARAGTGGAGPAEPAADVRLWVYRLRHARAARLSSTLQTLFGGRGGGTEQSVGLSRPSLSERLRGQQIAPVNADTLGRIPLPTAAAPAPGPLAGLSGQLRSEVQIVPEEFTNALLVRAVPEDWEVIRRVIEAVDLRPLQVAIEVLIAEVRRTDNLEVGLSGSASKRGRSGNPTVSGELTGPTTGTLVLEYLRTGRIAVDAALSLLASRGTVRILSRPLLLAQNAQEARILVGSERPFVQVFRSLPTDAAVRDQVVQYRDVGTSLTILPTINPDGYVNLQVAQEVSTATAETQFGAPVISTREATTQLFVRSGQTAVIGGLIDRQQDRSRTGIPLLVNIPLIGGLFGSTRVTNTHSELFIFLTPHVVDSDAELDRIRGDVERNTRLLDEGIRRAPPVVTPAPRSPVPEPAVPPLPTPATPNAPAPGTTAPGAPRGTP